MAEPKVYQGSNYKLEIKDECIEGLYVTPVKLLGNIHVEINKNENAIKCKLSCFLFDKTTILRKDSIVDLVESFLLWIKA